MLKRSLYFTEPCHLSRKDLQLVIHKRSSETAAVPVEDIGFIIIESLQITVTASLMELLNSNNTAVIFCDSKHHPNSMLLNLDGHHLQNELFRNQVGISEPLKKNLWKQTVIAKIRNQAKLLSKLGKDCRDIEIMTGYVKSGDMDNREGAAARSYWPRLFGPDFKREREGMPPNNLLNYGYIVLRAAVARSLTGSGLMPTLGIHHHSRYNAYCLADDIMEPYRPFVDELVYSIWLENNDIYILNKEIKANLLSLLTRDVWFGKNKKPLMVGLSSTTASLARCFSGDQKKLLYPVLI